MWHANGTTVIGGQGKVIGAIVGDGMPSEQVKVAA
jgi:hypothetical protein